MTSDQQLWNLDRKGTLILGDHRFGSHFLQAVIADCLGDRCRPLGLALCANGTDIIPSDAVDRADILCSFEQLTNAPDYSCLIVNDAVEKLTIMSRPDLLDHWHIVRLVRTDKIKWFISWWFYVRHTESNLHRRRMRPEGFHHHGTPRDNYQAWLGKQGRIRLDDRDILDLKLQLACHLLNYDIAADLEIDYEQLAALSTEHVAWKANEYPSSRLEDMFENADVLERLLLLWNRVQIKGRWRGHGR